MLNRHDMSLTPLYTDAWGENNIGIAETNLNALETRLVYQCPWENKKANGTEDTYVVGVAAHYGL